MSDPYKTLGVEKNATEDQIKTAYRKLARKYHPDVNPGDKEAEQKFKDVSNAYEILNDPVKRSQFDTWGTTDPRQRQQPTDFFEGVYANIFGRGFSNVADHSSNIQVQLKITLNEVAEGVTKAVNYQKRDLCPGCLGTGGKRMSQCPTCHGNGVQRSRQGTMTFQVTCGMCRGSGQAIAEKCDTCKGSGVTAPTDAQVIVNVPKGSHTGTQLRFEGAGESARASTGATGHLYVVIVVEDHPLFIRHENDLVVGIPLTYSRLIRGGKQDVPTLDGTVEIDIPPETVPGKHLRVRGKGLPDIHSGQVGDLIVVVELDMPHDPKGDYKDMIDRLADFEQRNPSDRIKEFTRLSSQSKKKDTGP